MLKPVVLTEAGHQWSEQGTTAEPPWIQTASAFHHLALPCVWFIHLGVHRTYVAETAISLIVNLGLKEVTVNRKEGSGPSWGNGENSPSIASPSLHARLQDCQYIGEVLVCRGAKIRGMGSIFDEEKLCLVPLMCAGPDYIYQVASSIALFSLGPLTSG